MRMRSKGFSRISPPDAEKAIEAERGTDALFLFAFLIGAGDELVESLLDDGAAMLGDIWGLIATKSARRRKEK